MNPMTRPEPVLTDALAWPLHLRAALGQELTAEERANLEAWYASQDQQEAASLASAPPPADADGLRADILAALSRISALAQKNQRLEEEKVEDQRRILGEELKLLEELLRDQG